MSILRGITRPILQPLLRSPLEPGVGSSWTPSRLFTTSEKGVAYDLSDVSKLYQDSARTTPVTANDDPIGSATDLSGNGVHANQATAAARPLYQGYADFDGTDDRLMTASAIDFTGTDKITVVLSVTKGSAARGVIAFLGTTNFNDVGSIDIESNSNAAGDYGCLTKGSTLGQCYTTAAYASPVTNVLSLQLDLAGATNTAEIAVRVDGAAASIGSRAGDAGTGNYGNYPIRLGSFGSGTTPFTGGIHRIIVIGRTLTAAELAQAEAWCAEPAGVTLA